ncbi:MAG: DUF1134 domain-containing protein [Hyphomicrobiaceae bacterium]
MPITTFAPKGGILLVASFVLSALSGTMASAEERLPWLRDPPQREQTYAQAGDVDRGQLPPPQGAEPDPNYNSAPPAGQRGYDRRDDVYHPPAQDRPYGAQDYSRRDDAYHPPARGDSYGAPPARTYGRDDAYRPPPRYEPPREYAAPYPPARSDEPEWRDGPGRATYGDRYASRAPAYDDREPAPRDGTFSMREIVDAGHGFFGSISQGLASVLEYAFKTQGRPNGYILGEDAGGAFVAGLRYGEGRLYTRDAGTHRVFWQGPSIGYDAGAEGSKVMVLVYNLRDPSEIYQRFGGVAGSAYVVGGVGMTFQQRDHIVLAPIRAGVGFRLGANVGYLKYTRRPTWNPF